MACNAAFIMSRWGRPYRADIGTAVGCSLLSGPHTPHGRSSFISSCVSTGEGVSNQSSITAPQYRLAQPDIRFRMGAIDSSGSTDHCESLSA